MRISLLHPSRSRPQKSFDTVQKWLSKVKGTTDIEIILSIDDNDRTAAEYWRIYEPINVIRIKNNNSCVVEATNTVAKVSTGDIMIYLSDDFDCPEGWDLLVRKEFENENRPLLIKVDDCLQKFEVPVLTIPIMNRALYERLGYFWHPGYKSMFVDEDLYWTARKLVALKMCEHLKFPHEHPANGKAPDDETYRRSAANWDQGKAMFAQRKSQGFPV